MITLCWSCKNACGKCSWSKKFKKVKGWVAEKTIIKGDPNGLEPEIKSYLVISCPKYKPDSPPISITNEKVAKWLGVNIHTYMHKTPLAERNKYKAMYFEYLLSNKTKSTK